MSISQNIAINYNKSAVIENKLHEYLTNTIDYRSYNFRRIVFRFYAQTGSPGQPFGATSPGIKV